MSEEPKKRLFGLGQAPPRPPEEPRYEQPTPASAAPPAATQTAEVFASAAALSIPPEIYESMGPAAVWVPIHAIKPWDKNPRVNDHVVDKIARSITEFGFANPILVRQETKVIIAGHTRYKAAIQLGLGQVPVRYLDLTEAQATQLAIADNRLGELAEWDSDALAKILKELGDEGADVELTGFDGKELERLMKSLTEENAGNGDPDAVPEDPPTRTARGEIWLLGRHRLYVGDFQDGLDRLMAGEKADMFFTDPPYGVDYVGKTEEALVIENDSMKGAVFFDFLLLAFKAMHAHIKVGGAWYICAPAGELETTFRNALAGSPLTLRQCLVWVKQHFVMGRMDFHWRHESILYGWESGGDHYHVDRKRDTVWEVDRPAASRDHPTMKPVELVEKALDCSSRKGELVADLFLGSGTTLIAAEKNGRTCYGSELSPRYADVIIARWEKFSGKVAVREGFLVG